MAAFPTGQPREDQLETVICKHCKRPVMKQAAAEHIRGCLRAKQEKARRKKEARDAANRAKEKVEKDGEDDGDGEEGTGSTMKGQKSAKKSAVKGMGDDGTKKGKKRKADGEDDKDKEPKKKKKKDEQKPKVPKPKGPVDVEKQCGVTLPNGAQCARSLTCKSHSMGAKRAVPGRSLPYDMLLQAYQKKNQARQQSEFFAHPLYEMLRMWIAGLIACVSEKQRRPSMPMHHSRTIWTVVARLTRMRNGILSWQLSLAHVHSLSSRTL